MFGGSKMKYVQLFLTCIGITYCALMGVFSVAGKDNGDYSHNVYYDNIQYTDNVEFYGVDGFNIQYSGELNYLGDYYEISFDVVNGSGTKMMLSKCLYQESDYYIDYLLTYDDDSEVSIGDTLKQGERKRLKYRVLYKNPIQSDVYELDSSFYISYEQVL